MALFLMEVILSDQPFLFEGFVPFEGSISIDGATLIDRTAPTTIIDPCVNRAVYFLIIKCLTW